MPKDKLTAGEARRIALAAQGFATARPAGPVSRRQLVKLVERLGVVQIDSVNVVSRTHYLPAFSRLGAYPREMLEEVAWARKRPLFEYWAHEASLLPLTSQPLFRWRMQDAHDGAGVWKGVALFLRERRDFVYRVLNDIAARWPRRVDAQALLSPFDNLIWFRERTERMFGVRYRIEIYTPAEKRTHGYYVLPFLEGDALTARVDLKSDRKAGVLIVQASHAEPWASDATPVRLAEELKLMAGWLGLESVRVEKRGDLSGALTSALA